ncbi:MAG: T9SS type A sorting domain-containing protein [Lewinella sp.]|nr:T9SS type A sorting domain-containing protein [Lewinella sp.]
MMQGYGTAFVAMFNGAGNRLWGTYHGGDNGARCDAICHDGAGHLYLTGSTSSSTGIALGGHQNTIGGYIDAFLSKISDTPPVCDIAISSVQATAATCPGADDGTLTIAAACTTCTGIGYDISGPVSQSNGTGIFSGLPDGLYTVTVTDTGDGTCTAVQANVSVGAGIDNTPPVISCATGMTLVFNGEDQFLMTNYQTQLVTSAQDACDGANLTYTYLPASISCAQVGQTVNVQVTICDQNGIPNCNSCTVPVILTGLPCGWSVDPGHIDCNDCGAGYDPATNTFQATAGSVSHTPYSGSPDQYAFVQTTLCGNGELIAHVDGLDGLGKGWAGLVMRESNAPDSKKFQLMTGLDYLQHRVDWRYNSGGLNQTQNFSRYGQHWLRIVRTGPIFQAFTSWDGVNWGIPVNTRVIPMLGCLEVGLITTNVPFATNVTATFSGVQVNGSAPRPDVPEAGTPAQGQFLQAYPNPTNGQLTLDLSSFPEQGATLEIVNAFGQLVDRRRLAPIDTATERVDLSTQAAGVYLIRLRLDDGRAEQVQVVKM